MQETSHNHRSKPGAGHHAAFDAHARSYQELVAASIAASGESAEYFGEYKLACLRRIGVPVHEPVLDFGCGVGSLTRLLADRFGEVHGYDPSRVSLEVARHGVPSAIFHDDPAGPKDAHFGTVVLSGVLHHVAPGERAAVLERVRRKLRRGGRVVVFEHNPLNPLTRRAVTACPFDDDAILLWPWEATRLLRRAAFHDVQRDFIVFFPRALAFLRPLEPRLRRVALGAQMMVVGRAG